jgi:hypothetical protein
MTIDGCQIWIVRHHESPREHIVDPFYLKNLVNWTITYRRDATIQVPYGYMTPLHQPKHQSQAGRSPEQTHNYATGKTKKIAWFVSNCGLTTNGRTNYVAELNK